MNNITYTYLLSLIFEVNEPNCIIKSITYIDPIIIKKYCNET